MSTGERSPAVLVWKVQPTPLDATLKSNRSSGRYARAARGHSIGWLTLTEIINALLGISVKKKKQPRLC